MKATLRWMLISIGVLVAVVILVLLIAPFFVDLAPLKAKVEQQVAAATGRSFRIGGDLKLSLFPTARLSLADLEMGNPPEFEEKEFLAVRLLDIRLKLLPLLFKDLQVKRFVLEGARVNLVQPRQGPPNWADWPEGPEGKARKTPSENAPSAKEDRPSGLPITSLSGEVIAVRSGSVRFVDQREGSRYAVTEIDFSLKGVSLDTPIGLDFSARLDGKPLSLSGTLGPIGKDPLPMDLSARLLEEVRARLKGNLTDLTGTPGFDLQVEVEDFSPRKLLAALGRPFPVQTRDASALSRVSLKADLRGNASAVSLSGGRLTLDDTRIEADAQVSEFSRPEAALEIKVDRIDLDRYLPDREPEKKAEGAGKPGGEAPPSDSAALRKLVLDAQLRVDSLTASGVELRDTVLRVRARDGIFRVDPLSTSLYEGTAVFKGRADLAQERPRIQLDGVLKGIQVNPLIRKLMNKDLLEGIAGGDFGIRFAGGSPDEVKSSLSGQGELRVESGALKGIDLPAMVRNREGAFGLLSAAGASAKTEFSELVLPFTLTEGAFATKSARMTSDLLRVNADGTADLVEETLDFRIEPAVVGTRKTDPEKMKASEIQVPVLVTGTFSDPKFAPDLKALARQEAEKRLFESKPFKKVFEKEELKPFGGAAKDLMKGLLGE